MWKLKYEMSPELRNNELTNRPIQVAASTFGQLFVHSKLTRRGVSLLSVVLLLGCSGSEENPDWAKRAPASGTVLYQGKPIEGAIVTFANNAAQAAATGVTDSAGHFDLTTYTDRDGAVPGQQVVSIRKVDVIDKAPQDADLSAGGMGPPPEVHWVIPQKYSIADQSGLTAEVTEAGPNDFTFDLK